jgi:predicted RNA-binding protein with PUA-like domain
MAYWLVKSEPNVWSWDDHIKKGVAAWTDVRNYQAANNMKAMKKGDRAFFYHSNIGKEIVGILEVVQEAYPDPNAPSHHFVLVDFKAVKPFKKSVTLSSIKAHQELQDIALIRQSRLSVMPITKGEWMTIIRMSNHEAA